jgi:hypothetical protein
MYQDGKIADFTPPAKWPGHAFFLLEKYNNYKMLLMESCPAGPFR